jgi:hypothetical protein
MTYTRKNLIKKTGKTRKHRIFKKGDFISGDGMMVSLWGPPMWHYLHTMSFNYPVQPTAADKRNYRAFILNLQNVLPCKYCRINLKTNFKNHPLRACHMENREAFSKYVYELHEIVNKLLGKTSGLSYCDVRERYEHFRARCTDEPNPRMAKTRKHKKDTTTMPRKTSKTSAETSLRLARQAFEAGTALDQARAAIDEIYEQLAEIQAAFETSMQIHTASIQDALEEKGAQ